MNRSEGKMGTNNWRKFLGCIDRATLHLQPYKISDLYPGFHTFGRNAIPKGGTHERNAIITAQHIGGRVFDATAFH